MKEIKLTQGKVAIVDDEDYEYLNQWNWCAHKTSIGEFRALRKGKSYFLNGKRIQPNIMMHRVIMKTPDDMEIDHINHNQLDNRKTNLRNCKHSENLRNRRPTVKYKGIITHYWLDKDGIKHKYIRARIKIDGKFIYAKGMSGEGSEELAAKAYNELASKHHGEFALLNKVI